MYRFHPKFEAYIKWCYDLNRWNPVNFREQRNGLICFPHAVFLNSTSYVDTPLYIYYLPEVPHHQRENEHAYLGYEVAS